MKRLLLRLYPKPWRDRYGEEFLTLLEDMGARPGPADLASIFAEAIRARIKYGRRRTLFSPAAVDSSAHSAQTAAVVPLESPVLEWLPLVVCLAGGLAAALAGCPVPRDVRVTGLEAVAYAALYTLGILAAGIVSYQVARIATGSRTMPGLRLFAALLWMAPLLTFLQRNSRWSIAVALLFGAIVARLGLHYAQATADTRASGFRFGFAVALCVDFAIVSLLAGASAYAALGFGLALVLLTWRLAPLPPRPVGAMRAVAYTGLSFALTCASFTPYLLANGASPGGFLQAWFGEGGTSQTTGKGLGRGTPRRLRSVQLIPGNWKSGFVLRPPVDEDKPLVVPPPPSLAKRLMGKPPAVANSAEPFEIPFDGVYWFYPAFRVTIPPDAGERRGDPVENGFHSNDGTPMVMEARQNLGRVLDLRSYREIEIVVQNADPVPGTVALQLLAYNTKGSRWNQQWINVEQIRQSTPGEHAPVRETLRFTIPAGVRWPEFDEFVVRFHLRAPRRIHSARISIERFRLIPRGI